MRYIDTLFWAVVQGQVVGYIGAALTTGTYYFTLTTINSFNAGVNILLHCCLSP
ncbi:YjzD family protein, partial [Enterococcus faecium]|uniref:YjzD family protein n=1 Tax=Enterococcus faecium TaxID=1352 RepID=UPI003CC62C04